MHIKGIVTAAGEPDAQGNVAVTIEQDAERQLKSKLATDLVGPLQLDAAPQHAKNLPVGALVDIEIKVGA